MTGKVETSLKKLSLLSKSLNEASDELSKQISAIESALNDFKFGTWVWAKTPVLTETEISEPDGAGNRYQLHFSYRLGYGKHKGKWGLLISYGWDEAEEPEVVFLKDASRHVRIKAMDTIPELLENISEEVSSLTQEAAKKASDAKEIAESLSGGNKKSR